MLIKKIIIAAQEMAQVTAKGGKPDPTALPKMFKQGKKFDEQLEKDLKKFEEEVEKIEDEDQLPIKAAIKIPKPDPDLKMVLNIDPNNPPKTVPAPPPEEAPDQPKKETETEARGMCRKFPLPVRSHAAVSVDRGRGVLVCGGATFKLDDSGEEDGDVELTDECFWLRLGYDQSLQKVRWFGHIWAPADIALPPGGRRTPPRSATVRYYGNTPSPREKHTFALSPWGFEHPLVKQFLRNQYASHPAMLLRTRAGLHEPIVLLFGGYDGYEYLNDLYVIANTQQDTASYEVLLDAARVMNLTERAGLLRRRVATYDPKKATKYCKKVVTDASVRRAHPFTKKLKFWKNCTMHRCLASVALPWIGGESYVGVNQSQINGKNKYRRTSPKQHRGGNQANSNLGYDVWRYKPTWLGPLEPAQGTCSLLLRMQCHGAFVCGLFGVVLLSCFHPSLYLQPVLR